MAEWPKAATCSCIRAKMPRLLKAHAASHNGNIGPRAARARLLRLCRRERHQALSRDLRKSHYNFVRAPELAPIIDNDLADPLTNPHAGAAAASQAAPE